MIPFAAKMIFAISTYCPFQVRATDMKNSVHFSKLYFLYPIYSYFYYWQKVIILLISLMTSLRMIFYHFYLYLLLMSCSKTFKVWSRSKFLLACLWLNSIIFLVASDHTLSSIKHQTIIFTTLFGGK